ncbi:MAG: helix-turn-helix transcriptional regulator [Kineosporiaceae bacterium]
MSPLLLIACPWLVGHVRRGLVERIRSLEGEAAPEPPGAVEPVPVVAVPTGDEPWARLTVRECEVLSLLAGGLSNAEIAERVVLSTETVKKHVASILLKLGVRDRAQAAILVHTQVRSPVPPER